MTEIEKLKWAVKELDTDPDASDMLHRLIRKIEGQSESYKRLQTAHDKVIERHDRYRGERNEARFKAAALVSIMIEVLAQAQTSPMPDAEFRAYVIGKFKPLAHALGHTYMEDLE